MGRRAGVLGRFALLVSALVVLGGVAASGASSTAPAASATTTKSVAAGSAGLAADGAGDLYYGYTPAGGKSYVAKFSADGDAAADRSTPVATLGPEASNTPLSASSAGCHVPFSGFSLGEETISLSVDVSCGPAAPGVTYGGRLFATMASSLQLVGHATFDGKDELSYVASKLDLCSLPGGSDLPGAKVTWEAVVDRPGPGREVFSFHDTLAPDRPEPPVVTAASTPAHGAVVHAGETITVHITATEPTNDGPQEGIHDIQLIGPDGLIKSKDYGTHPIACDKSRLSKELTATYTVPNNPPATIKLTAIAHDFVNRERTLSANFPTGGQMWTGTFDLEEHSICPVTSIGTVALTVNGSGQVNGTTTGNYTRNDQPCNVPDSGASAFTGVVTGTRLMKQFTLSFYMQAPAAPTVINNVLLIAPITVPLTSSSTASAHGTDQNEPSASGPVYRTYSVSLTCKTGCPVRRGPS